MKRLVVRWRTAVTALLASALLFALALPALLLYTRPLEGRVADLSIMNAAEEGRGEDGWSVYRYQAGEAVPLVPDGAGGYEGLEYDGQTFYYARTLDGALESPCLHIDTANRSVAVFLDGRLLYTDVPGLDHRPGRLELPMQRQDRSEAVVVTLPVDCGGGRLTIAQSTSPLGGEVQGRSTVYPSDVTLYSGFAYESGLIASATGTAMWMALLCFLAALLLLLLLYQAFQGRADWGVLFLAALLLVRMVGVMADSDFRLQYLPWMTTPDLTTLSWQLSAAAAACFLAVHMNRRFRYGLWGTAAAQTALSLLLCRYQLDPVGQPWFLEQWMPTTASALLLLAAMVLSGVCWRRGNGFFARYCRVVLCVGAVLAAVLGALLVLRPAYRASLGWILTSMTLSNAVFPLRVLNLLAVPSCVAVVALEFFRSQAEQGARRAALTLRAQMARESYEAILRQAEEVAVVRHDLRKHLAVTSALLSDGQTDKARDYLGQVTRGMDEIHPVVDTGNYLIDILLNSRLSALRDRGVRLEVRRASAPATLPIADADLSALLLNALDNAVRSVTSPEVSDPWVALDLHTKGGYL